MSRVSAGVSHRAMLALGLGMLLAGACGAPAPTPSPPALGSARSPGPGSLDGFAPSGSTERAPVIRVSDGDTIVVRIGSRQARVRYIGIDTPEVAAAGHTAEPWADAADRANRALVAGRDVVLERDVSEVDRYDRLLRYVWLPPASAADGWVLVNLELVEAGLAEAREYPPDTRYAGVLDAAEQEARKAGRGLWSE